MPESHISGGAQSTMDLTAAACMQLWVHTQSRAITDLLLYHTTSPHTLRASARHRSRACTPAPMRSTADSQPPIHCGHTMVRIQQSPLQWMVLKIPVCSLGGPCTGRAHRSAPF